MLERDAAKPLTGRVETDDDSLGGERPGGKPAETRSACGRGRGAPGQTPFTAAVEATPEGKPARPKPGRIASFRGASVAGFAKLRPDPGPTLRVWPACTAASDGSQCFGGVADAGCARQAIKTGPGPAAARVPAFKGVNAARQHRAGDRRRLPCDRSKARAALLGRVRMSLQPALQSGRHGRAPMPGPAYGPCPCPASS